SRAVQEISDSGSVCTRQPEGCGTGNSFDRVLPEQDEVHYGSRQGAYGKIRRRGAANDGRDAYDSRCGAENGERSSWDGLRNCERSRSGYARAAAIEPAGPDAKRRSKENRAGSNEDYSAGAVDLLFASADLARASRLLCAQSEVY